MRSMRRSNLQRPRVRSVTAIWILGLVGLLSSGGASGAEIAQADLFAPVSFEVVDVEATVDLLAQTGELTPIVIRRKPGVANEAVAQLRDAFERARGTFLDDLQVAFGEREIGSREINSSRFRNLRNEFQAANPAFPVNLVLAQSWAKGYTGDVTLDRLSAALEQVMADRLIGPIRPASTVFLAEPVATTPMRNWGEVAAFASVVNEGGLIAIDAAGLELRRMLDALDRVAGGFLSGLLQPNFVEDRHLTGLLLRERLGERALSRKFEQGERLTTAGQPVGAWEKLALNHLDRIGLMADTHAPQGTAAPASAAERKRDPGAGAVVVVVEWLQDNVPWVIAGGCAGLAFAVCLLVVVRSRPRLAVSDLALPPEEAIVTTPLVREALLPHLAREMKDRLVRVLFAQRGALLENEEAASQRVAEMEARIARLQPAIAERIRGYEERIRTLEEQLKIRDEETRDLIRAKLVLARKELDDAVSGKRIDWN